MSECILSAGHIQKRYGRNAVLRDVSIHVKQGEIYGLVGKNGSGKTTLFRILTGLIPKYGGDVAVGMVNGQAAKISAVINSPSLFLNMTAFQNMKEQAYLLGIHDDGKIEEILNMVGLSRDNKTVKNFSLGMTQRLKLGIALLESPDILILDEPANGLDPDGIAELRELLLDLNRSGGSDNRGITILISSHVLNELEQIVTCIGILHNGEIVKEFSTCDALQNGMTLEKIYMQYTRGGSGND